MNQFDRSGIFMRGHSELKREGGKRFSEEIPTKTHTHSKLLFVSFTLSAFCMTFSFVNVIFNHIFFDYKCFCFV